MADNTTLDAGSGGDTIATDDVAGIKYQRVKLTDGTADSSTIVAAGGGSEANALRVTIASDSTGVVSIDDNGGSLTVDGTVGVSGTVTVDGSGATQPVSNAGTFAVQDSQKLADNAAFTDGTTKVQPVGYILDETAGTALAENDIGAARMDSKRAQVYVLEDATTRGQRASVSSGGALKVDGSAATQPISAASLPLPSGAATAAKQPALGTAGSASSDVLTVQGIASMTALKVDGSAVTQPVSGTVGVSGTVAVTDNSGSLTVDAPVGTPVFATITPSTTGGWSKVTALAQTTTKKVIKSSAGTFGGYYVYNPNASVAYIQVFDLASASVTVGTTAPDLVFGIPASSAANLEIANGVNMANAIVLVCTTTATGSTAPSTGLDITAFYK